MAGALGISVWVLTYSRRICLFGATGLDGRQFEVRQAYQRNFVLTRLSVADQVTGLGTAKKMEESLQDAKVRAIIKDALINYTPRSLEPDRSISQTNRRAHV